MLTNELHRHLGIYSLVGVKMGIRARELLDASLDDLSVESHAGLRPPMSCLTDGLQVATGATLGRGTIRVEGNDPAPKAIFAKGDARLELALKDDVWRQIRSDVAAAVEQFGNLTPEYFDEVRRLSIRYWLTLDRREISERRCTLARLRDPDGPASWPPTRAQGRQPAPAGCARTGRHSRGGEIDDHRSRQVSRDLKDQNVRSFAKLCSTSGCIRPCARCRARSAAPRPGCHRYG